LHSSLVRRSRRAAVTASLLWASLPFLFYSRLPHPSWGKAAFGLFAGPTAGRARFGASGGSDRWSMPDGWSLDGAGDLPLAALFSAGVLLLILHLARDRGERAAWGEPVLAGLLLGGGALMKNEGLALLAVAALALGPWGLWMARSRGGLRSALVPLALALGTALVVAGPWLAVRGEVPTIGEDYPSRLSPAGLVEAWGASQPVLTDLDGAAPYERRVPALVARGFASALTSVPRFGLVWLLFGLGLLVGLLRPRRFLDSPALPAALAVLGAFALYALVLLVTPWNLSSLFKTAIPDRLVLHVAPLAIFATALLLAGRSSATTPASAGSAEEDPEAVRGTDREPGS
jgi:hypothetical protein